MTDAIRPVYRITDLNETERPRERLSALGPQALSNAELLGILLRGGVRRARTPWKWDSSFCRISTVCPDCIARHSKN